MLTHQFVPAVYQAKVQAKVDHAANVLAQPNPPSVPALTARVKLIEGLLGV